MPWYDVWGLGPWLLFPILMCMAMMAMMLLMGRGRMGRGCMGWYGSGQMGERRTDTALETLRQRFASGELSQQEYEEQRNLLLRE